MTDGIRLSKLKYFSQRSYPPPPGLRNTNPLRPVGGWRCCLTRGNAKSNTDHKVCYCCISILPTMSLL